MRRISILTVVALVVFLGCSGSAPKSELRENPLRLDEVGENDTSWVDLFNLGETAEAWACFGTPDEYDNEKEVVAVVIYRYKDRPTLEVVKQLKAMTANREVIYFTEPVTKDQKPQYVIRETGVNGGHYLFRPISTPPRKSAKYSTASPNHLKQGQLT